ncbi:MAG: bifunctional oligoribonuclease/PAP phosphatase NrnA [Eggerthellaceae bacterium]|nr:bifunctional oligoribonuclease/PAP phosphatase NrnA [Eggerthellaceae bacterium]
MTTTPQTNASFADMAELMRTHDNFVICGHVSPDGDCLGSQLALYHALKALGKQANCVLVRDEPVEDSLSFMPGLEEMVPAAQYDGFCDVFIGVDVPTRERVGAAVEILDRAQTSITIDHHAADQRMCDLAYVDPDSASASMLIWEIVKLLCDKPPIESAFCAYVGLVTDTGGFRHQNSDAKAFEAASELVSYGIDLAHISTKVFDSRSLASLKLEALTIDRIEVFADGLAAISWVKQGDFDRLGAIKADAEPLIDAVRSLSGIRVACMLREQDGKVRGSLRSKDQTDISVIARSFGGGGHKAASGFTLDMPLEKAIETVRAQIEELLG